MAGQAIQILVDAVLFHDEDILPQLQNCIELRRAKPLESEAFPVDVGVLIRHWIPCQSGAAWYVVWGESGSERSPGGVRNLAFSAS